MILYNSTEVSNLKVIIHNSVSVTNDSKRALNTEFTQRGHQWCTLFRRMKGQKHSYYHVISVCFNKPCTLGAEMRSKICTKYTLEGGSSRSHYMEESFWRRLWTCRQTEYWM